MKAMDFFVYVLLAVALIIMFCVLSQNPTTDDISHYETKNAALLRECNRLQLIVVSLDSLKTAHEAKIDSLKRLIDQNNAKITEKRMEHEKEIIRIDRMSPDSLFYFFTEYLQ